MKALFHNEISLKDAVKISFDKLDVQIWRYDLDCYALTTGTEKVPVSAFHSLAFSDLITSLRSDVIEISLIRGERLNGRSFDHVIELHMLTADGRRRYIDDMDTLWCCSEIQATEPSPPGVFSAMDLLQIRSAYPVDRMLFTSTFLRGIMPYLKRDSSTEVLSRIWRDTHKSMRVLNTKSPVTIVGEYGTYAAIEQLCGRVLFMTEKEAIPEG